MRHVFFILLFFLHFNWPLSPCTSKTKTERFILAYFWESSRITRVFNPFLPKKKKKKLTWNKWNSDFYTIKCPRQNKCVRQLWDTDFIVWPYYRLFSLAWIFWSNLVLPPKVWKNYGRLIKKFAFFYFKPYGHKIQKEYAQDYCPWGYYTYFCLGCLIKKCKFFYQLDLPVFTLFLTISALY